MIQKITYEEYLQKYAPLLVVDVRSPGEYDHAHIPTAYNMPLFSNEERVVVGTAYKQESKEIAIKIGLDYFGPKMRTIVETVESLLSSRGEKQVVVHCWRGGMRSGGVAWLLDLYGYEVFTLIGGYKAYRTHVLDLFTKEFQIKKITGYTGSGKTAKLLELQKSGEQILDFEGLAKHKGSAFGHIGLEAQPSQEMFENLIASKLDSLNRNSQIWVEDECLRLGHVNIPKPFFLQMKVAPEMKLDISFEQRLDNIIKEYGSLDPQQVIDAVIRIKKRLGGLETQNILNFLEQNDIRSAYAILLKYYDKAYDLAGLKV
jgi:tRNA 2-selenouridine synthase